MLKVALVGCGAISTAHMQVYSILKNDVKVISVCDTDTRRAKYLANRFKINSFFDNHMDMLEKEKPDLVDICTPTSTHAHIAVDAAKNGSCILVEKPMARSTQECKIMIKEAEKNSVSLCICHIRIFSPSLLKAKELLDKRNLKINICAVRSRTIKRHQRNWFLDRKEGGVLWEIGYHTAYIQKYLLGSIDQVFALSRSMIGGIDDTFYVLLHSTSGALGLMEISLGDYPEFVFCCQIDTETGEQIELDLNSEYIGFKSKRKHGAYKKFGANLSSKILYDITKFGKARLGYAVKYMSGRTRFIRRLHLFLIKQYVESLRNRSNPPVTPQDGLETIQILESIENSIEKGVPIDL